jgi:hypothetical protein
MRTIRIGTKTPAANTAVRVKLDNGKTVAATFNGTAFVGADGAPVAGAVAYFIPRKTAN